MNGGNILVKGTCTYTQTESDFSYWSSLPSLPIELRESIRQADIVIVPQPGFGDYTGPLFPVKTEELFRHLRDNVPAGMKVELGVEDADYRELALHSEIVIIATILAKWLGAPLAVGLIKDYLMKRLGKRFKTAEVRFTMIVDHSEGGNKKTGQISYEGPAQTFETSLKDALKSFGAPPAKKEIAPSESQAGSQNDTHRNRKISDAGKRKAKRSDT
jgi:hypothetical protein